MSKKGVIMNKTRRYKIDVCKKGKRHGEPGDVVETIERVIWAEQIGNFNPFYCRYRGLRTLVKSYDGDLDDPFRRDPSFLKTLYIEPTNIKLTDPISLSAAEIGRIGGQVKSERKTNSARENGKLGGRPRKITLEVTR